VLEVSLAVSVLLGTIPVTESPSARPVASFVYMMLGVLVVGESGEGGVVDAAALGLGDVVVLDGAAEGGGRGEELGAMEQVEQVEAVAGEGDGVANEESVKIPEGMTADGEAGEAG